MPTFLSRSQNDDQQADVGRFALLLAIVILIIGTLGLVGLPRQADDTGVIVRILVTVLAGGVLFATLRITRIKRRNRRRFETIMWGLVLVSVVGFLITSNPVLGTVVAFFWLVLVIAAPAAVLKQVLASDRVTIQTILGAITVYLLIGVALAFIAIAMEGSVGFFEVVPRSTAYVYFSFVTITTLGYGDLSPYTDGARMVSVISAVTAQMYLVIVVARLVSIWSPHRTAAAPGGDE